MLVPVVVSRIPLSLPIVDWMVQFSLSVVSLSYIVVLIFVSVVGCVVWFAGLGFVRYGILFTVNE